MRRHALHRRRAHFKRRSLAELQELDRKLDAYLCAGGTPKGFAMDYDRPVAWVYPRARALGWAPFYINKEERARILSRRKNQSAAYFDSAA